MDSFAVVAVEIMVAADLPEPQRPYDGTDTAVPIEEFEAWTRAHADLALVCTGTACPGTMISDTVVSELEMLHRPFCNAPRGSSATCSLEIRIKNGATLQPCGSTTTERVGVAWRQE